MRPRRVRVWVRSAGVTVGIVVVLISLGASSAWAGGWAVSSIDPMAVPVAGASTVVGFTIRQHGVTPVNPEGKVGVSIRSASGAEQFFVGTPQGPHGHYVSRVRFSQPGTYQWQIYQGWFQAQDLGPLQVDAPSAVTAVAAGARERGTPSSEYLWPLPARLLVPALALGLGVFAVADAVRARRRRARELAPT